MKFLTKSIFVALSLTALTLTGCGGGSKGENPVIDGVDGPSVEFVGGKVFLSMVLKNVQTDGGLVIPIPKYPNSTLQVGPDFNSNGTLLLLTIDAPDWLSNKGQGLDPQNLPGGRPLPGVAGGSLPAIALLIPSLNNSILYLGPQLIGFFVPFHLNTNGAIVSFRYYNKDGEAVGNLSLVGADANGKNSGILVMMNADLLGLTGATKAAKQATMLRYMRMGY